ncbi:MAG: hypothetical protein HDR71_13365 [Lachnospiraceae bacterium]|nr:hypothetical protein [Lachnospiraceae bacterium]
MNINYKKEPNIFSNTAFIDYSYFELLYDMLDYAIPIVPETIIGLSILAETIVLHEEVVPTNNELICSNDDEKELIFQFVKSGVLNYEKIDDLFIPNDNSAAKMLDNELTQYKQEMHLSPNDVNANIIFVNQIESDFPIEENLSTYRIGYYDEEHLDKAIEYAAIKDKIAKLHGMPHINGIYFARWGKYEYIFRMFHENIDTSISKDFLENIDKKRFAYIEKIKKYLGSTYVGLPSVISIILSRAKDVTDIPNQIILLREEIAKFRKTCTNYEYNLRIENNFLRQCEIIDELENAYNSLSIDGNFKKKRRIIKECAEVFNPNPLTLSTNIGKKIINELDDKYIQLKVPGYYDLYRKAFDVEDNLSSLRRLFGNMIDDKFIYKLNKLSKI